MADELCKTWVLSWDQTGLESVVLAYDPEWLMDRLTGNDEQHRSVNSTVNSIIMRARFNTHRHYEVYAINFDYDMTEELIRDTFNVDPQCMVDLIRERGHKLWSDRQPAHTLIR
jgi:cytidylate kinase